MALWPYNTSVMEQNTTVGNNTEGKGGGTLMEHPIESTVALVISWIEFVLITILNALLIIILLKRKTKSRMSFFVLHLSVSDLTLGIIYLLPDAYQRTTGKWISQSGENISCIIYQYLSHVAVYASTYMLVVLTIDRLYVILRPLNSSKRGKWYKYSMVSAAWVIAFVLSLPQPIDGACIWKNDGNYMCDLVYSNTILEQVFVTGFVCAVMILPIIILLVCYTWIVLIIWTRKDLSGHGKGTYGNIDSSNAQISGGSSIMSRARIRSVQMTFVVVIVYIVCWSPFMVNLLLATYRVIELGPYYFILMALAPVNSAANPVVFMIFNRNMLLAPSVPDKSNQQSTATVTTALLHSKIRTSPQK